MTAYCSHRQGAVCYTLLRTHSSSQCTAYEAAVPNAELSQLSVGPEQVAAPHVSRH